MRKGRSSRRSRIPRPISVVPPSTPALSAELRPASAPHVVLGVSPSEPPASREPERSSREAEGARFTSGAVVVTEALATEILAERDAHDVSAKEIAADDGGEVPRAAANDEGEVPRAAAERETRAPIEAKREELDGTEEPDEVSVPPMGDLSVDEQFFSEGDLSHHFEGDVDDDALAVNRASRRKVDPDVVERRTRFARYVRWAVVGAAVVCLAAVGRAALSTSSSAPSVAVAARAAHAIALPATAIDPPAAAKADEPAPAPVVTGATSTTPAATPSSEEAAGDEVTGDARAEKAKARSLLEKRDVAGAIEAGARSVRLDPSDGEAWLILGAAHQEKGNMVEARRAYASCVKEAKTGPRQECANLLR